MSHALSDEEDWVETDGELQHQSQHQRTIAENQSSSSSSASSSTSSFSMILTTSTPPHDQEYALVHEDTHTTEISPHQLRDADTSPQPSAGLLTGDADGTTAGDPTIPMIELIRRDSFTIGREEQLAQEADYALDTPQHTQRPGHMQQQQQQQQVRDALSKQITINEIYVREREETVQLTDAPSASPPAATPPVPIKTPRFGLIGVYLALIGAQFCWSGFHLFAKVAFNYMHPLVLPMLRAFGTTPIMFVVCYYLEGPNFWRVARKDLLHLAAIGCIVCAGCQNFFNFGLMLTTAADGGITQPAIPIFAAVLAISLKREVFSWLKALGIVCAVIGTLCIVLGETYLIPESEDDKSSPLASGAAAGDATTDSSQVTAGRRLLGLACFMVQCFLFSIYLLIQKPLLSRVSPLTITFYMFFFGQFGTSLISPYFAVHNMDWSHLPFMWFVSMFYTIIFASIGGFLLFNYAGQYLPASVSSMGCTIQPFGSSLLGFIFLGEVITYLHFLGGLFLIAGLSIVIWSRSRDATAAAARTSAQLFEANQERLEANNDLIDVAVVSEITKEHEEASQSSNTNNEEVPFSFTTPAKPDPPPQQHSFTFDPSSVPASL